MQSTDYELQTPMPASKFISPKIMEDIYRQLDATYSTPPPPDDGSAPVPTRVISAPRASAGGLSLGSALLPVASAELGMGADASSSSSSGRRAEEAASPFAVLLETINKELGDPPEEIEGIAYEVRRMTAVVFGHLHTMNLLAEGIVEDLNKKFAEDQTKKTPEDQNKNLRQQEWVCC